MIGKYKLNPVKTLERMQELGLTYAALAKKTGQNVQTIENAIRNGTGILEKTAERIAEGLGLSLEAFLDEGYVTVAKPNIDCTDMATVCRKEQQKKMISVLTKNLRARQKYLQISRVKLAECTQLSQREIFKLMNGHVNPKITTLVCIAKALDVSLDDLITDGYDQTLVAK